MTSCDPIQNLLTANRLNPRDFEEKRARSPGPGGQHVNKVSVAIRLRHLATGLTAIGRQSRSLHLNRLYAYRELVERVQALQRQNSQKQQALIAKKRRQKARRSFKTKESMRHAKRKRSEIKRQRDKIIF